MSRSAIRDHFDQEIVGVLAKGPISPDAFESRRPLLDLEPIGREKDIEWLKTSRGHRVLAGEPGSGKTFLLRHLMLRRDWPALFLTRPDASDAEIANAVRDQQPKVIVVDDAHVDPSRLTSLVRLFREIHAEIDIVASTWLGGEEQVVAALGGLPAAQVRRLELLTRDEIVQVMNQVGLVDIDPQLMRHLVDQAGNRPGLAVTIASLALHGSWQEVIDGSALERNVRSFFESFVGSEARDFLAGLSLGGDRGMRLTDVGEFLEISPSRALQIASGVAAGGVIRDVDRIDGVLAVWPRQLRSALLRTVFFSGTALKLDYKPLFEMVPDRAKAVDAIVDTLSLGAHLEPNEVHRLVAEFGSPSIWSNLAALSRDHGEWVVANFPGDFRAVAAGVLLTAPEPAIEKILELEEEDDAAGRERSDPFFPLRSWIQDLRGAQEATGVAIERRRILVQSVLRFLERGGSQSVGLRAVFLALSPRLESSALDPGAGRTVTSTRGILSVGDLARLQGIWTLVSGRFSTLDTTAWFALQSAVNGWKSPESLVGVLLDDSYHEPLDQLASLVITDLARLASGSPGLALGFADLAAKVGIDLEIVRDPVFDLLFAEPPISDSETRVRACADREEAVRQLARTWSDLSASEAADKLAFYCSEGQRVGKRRSYFFWVLSDQLALQASRAKDWLQALVERGFSRNVVHRFLAEVLSRKEEGWAEVLHDLLAREAYSEVAVDAALRLEDLPQDLLERVLARVPDHLHALHMSTAGEIPSETAKALLLHDSVEVALLMAAEEWNSEPHREIRREIRDEWRTALLRVEEVNSPSVEFRHREILASEPEIAAEWARRKLPLERLQG